MAIIRQEHKKGHLKFEMTFFIYIRTVYVFYLSSEKLMDLQYIIKRYLPLPVNDLTHYIHNVKYIPLK